MGSSYLYYPQGKIMYALIDCNNFFASCEELFNPKLKNKPLVVLSNNDGCIISRSKTAKKMNIKMGDPIFLYKDLIEAKKLLVQSSNFTLYGDMSNRVMQTLKSFSLPMEIYSIDEAFLYIDDNYPGLEELASELKEKTTKWTGIPVSVGIATTKTLAKLANETAKKEKGTIVLKSKEEIDLLLKKTDVADIWGIGRNLTKRLNRLSIYSAYQLKQSPEALIKKHLSVNVLKTLLELNGTSCFECLESPNPTKSIIRSRSFSSKVTSLKEIEEAISLFASLAAEKLREDKLTANMLSVFLNTSYHSQDPFYANTAHFTFPLATSYTPEIIKYAKMAIKKIYKEGYLYKKAGVVLSNLTSSDHLQEDLFEKKDLEKQKKIMKAFDKINLKANKKALFFASEGIDQNWKSLSKLRSQRYTTSFDELKKVK